MRKNESQPPRNHLKLETINNLPSVQSIHRKSTIQIWSSKYGERKRATRDVISDKKCNEMREQRDKKKTKWNQETVEPSSSYEKSIEVRSPKTRLENQDEQRLLTPNQRRGKQHQRQLNSDPTQRDVVSNRSQNLRKKRTNIDRNNIQRRKKQPHNMELICMIYNKY